MFHIASSRMPSSFGSPSTLRDDQRVARRPVGRRDRRRSTTTPTTRRDQQRLRLDGFGQHQLRGAEDAEDLPPAAIEVVRDGVDEDVGEADEGDVGVDRNQPAAIAEIEEDARHRHDADDQIGGPVQQHVEAAEAHLARDRHHHHARLLQRVAVREPGAPHVDEVGDARRRTASSPARKCQVQISPCGRIGLSQCETGALSASAAIRIPVNRLTTKAIAVTQCSVRVPTSVRGGWSCRSPRPRDTGASARLGRASAARRQVIARVNDVGHLASSDGIQPPANLVRRP